jgi:hypothetical protein
MQMLYVRSLLSVCLVGCLVSGTLCVAAEPEGKATAEKPRLKLHWEKNILTISGPHVPGREVKILYLEAYCRPNSHTTDWNQHTVIGHTTTLDEASEDGHRLKLTCRLKDGVVVKHVITAGHDEVPRSRYRKPTGHSRACAWARSPGWAIPKNRRRTST